jgi:dsRNA-specific ribonuclease
MSYQQQLKTYIDRNNLTINYEEKQVAEQAFIARVIISDDSLNNTEYEWTLTNPSKKQAKQEAAKIALDVIENEEYVEPINKEESIKDILIDIRELLKLLVEKVK